MKQNNHCVVCTKGNRISTADVQQEAHQLVWQVKRRATKIRPKAVGGDIFRHFSKFKKCLPEVADDDVSGVAVD